MNEILKEKDQCAVVGEKTSYIFLDEAEIQGQSLKISIYSTSQNQKLIPTLPSVCH